MGLTRLDLIRGTRSRVTFHPRTDVHGLAFASFCSLTFLVRASFFFELLLEFVSLAYYFIIYLFKVLSMASWATTSVPPSPPEGEGGSPDDA